MEHKVWYNEENQVVYLKIVGFYSTEHTQKITTLINDLVEGKSIRQQIVDLRDAGKMESRETRSATNKMLNKAGFTDVAYIGANAATRMIAKVLMKLGNLKAASDFFKDEEEAIEWLMKRRK